jgi:hypothetical protein
MISVHSHKACSGYTFIRPAPDEVSPPKKN